ncbi:MAG TPA: hypothetical protein PK014_05525 [Thermoanaerobaculia bacterium]|nr:hypothetical protein [Thermoanaerobaculia bacterium]HUM28716.1 hypothetical protein [Thermoanaerobaculia bacterium]HXK68035.1 hypothetical protein [Thermoanaerobaculia bacterium]
MDGFPRLIRDVLVGCYAILSISFFVLLLLLLSGELSRNQFAEILVTVVNLLPILWILLVISTLGFLVILLLDLADRHVEKKTLWGIAFILISFISLPLYYAIYVRRTPHG